jgi:hypothetical protein
VSIGSIIGDVVEAIFFRGQTVTIGELSPDVTLDEQLQDSVTVTDHPVEIGASISDHAFMNPSEVMLRIGFTNSKGFLALFTGNSSPTPAEAYEQLQDMMREREPIDLITSRRAYTDMLITALSVTTDDKTANILAANVKLRQIILVSTSSTALKPDAQAEPEKTSSVENAGTKQAKAVKESALSTIAGVFR